MVVGICRLELEIVANQDLKGKRRVLQSLIAKMRAAYNVSVAEVDNQDKWQRATLGLASVSSDPAYVHGLLTKVVQSVETGRDEVRVLRFEIELL